jgi:hypothetical protein
VHPGLDFWRIGRDVWRVAGGVEVVRDGPAGAAFVALFSRWLDGAAPVRSFSPRAARDVVTVGAVL